MQIKKDETYFLIVETARNEFLLKGYKNTSMRIISEKSGVGLSNIYNYFKNKDAIFFEILSPVIFRLNKLQKDHNCEQNLSIELFTSVDYLKCETSLFVELITEYKEELNLLFHGAVGSKLENFKEDYINSHTEIGLEYMKLMKKKYPQLNVEVSDFFIHSMSSGWVGIMGELVMHDLTSHELQKFIYEYLEFSTAGWKKIMKV